jgi:hypothetical protein
MLKDLYVSQSSRFMMSISELRLECLDWCEAMKHAYCSSVA